MILPLSNQLRLFDLGSHVTGCREGTRPEVPGGAVVSEQAWAAVLSNSFGSLGINPRDAAWSGVCVCPSEIFVPSSYRNIRCHNKDECRKRNLRASPRDPKRTCRRFLQQVKLAVAREGGAPGSEYRKLQSHGCGTWLLSLREEARAECLALRDWNIEKLT